MFFLTTRLPTRYTLTSTLFPYPTLFRSLLAGACRQSTLLSIRAWIEDFPIVVTGLVMSAYYAGYIVGSTVCGPLIYRVGHIRAFAAFAAIASAVPLLHGLSADAIAWIPLRAVSGFSFFGLFMVMEIGRAHV